MEKLMRISEIAEKYGISRPALIHYDSIDLLKPSVRKDNGYRYYTDQDQAKLELILALRESDLPIKKIKSLLQNRSEATTVTLLEQQKEEIDHKIQSLLKTQAVIDRRISMLKAYLSVDLYEGMKIDSYPSMVIVKESVGYGPLMGYDSAKNRLKNKLGNKAPMESKFGVCYDIRQAATGSLRMQYVYHYLDLDDAIATTEVPAATYLRTLHYGSDDTVLDTVKAMLTHLQTTDWAPGDNAYFVPILNYWELATEDEFVNEILIPIQSPHEQNTLNKK